MDTINRQIYNRKVTIEGISIFYRESGDRKHPSLLLLHGFPTSSLMFKNLMIALSERYHLIAPDYPGCGFSDFPGINEFEYSFDALAKCMIKFIETIGLSSFTLYLHDYGCPIGLRIGIAVPEKINGIIIQNGNAYIEGIGPQWDETRDYWKHPTPEKKKKVSEFLSEEGTKMQYTAGVPDSLLDRLSPESWVLDWERMSRPGNIEMQFQLNCTFETNLEMYPRFHEYFRSYQPRTLVIWGKYDVFFDVAEADCYQRDLHDVQTHILEGGHKALETNFDEVLALVTKFVDK